MCGRMNLQNSSVREENYVQKTKTLQELTIRDNFMFGAVMSEEENCRRFLELALEISIARVEIIKEKSISYHPEYKGVRYQK